MLEFSAVVAKMFETMAALVAERARALDVAADPPTSRDVGVEYARKCVGGIIAGVRNFGNELPEVQRLFQDLADALAAMRQPAVAPVGPPQQSLQAVFARQTAQNFQIGTGPASSVAESAVIGALEAPSVAATSLAHLTPPAHTSDRALAIWRSLASARETRGSAPKNRASRIGKAELKLLRLSTPRKWLRRRVCQRKQLRNSHLTMRCASTSWRKATDRHSKEKPWL